MKRRRLLPADPSTRSAGKPRRIVFVNRYYHPDLSATSQMLQGLAVRLAARGMTVEVVCSRQLYEDAAARLPAREVVDGVRIHRVWTTRFGRAGIAGRALDYLSFYAAAGWCLLRRVRSGDVLVAKTDPPLISLVACVVTRLRGAVLVNWLQDLFPEVAAGLAGPVLPHRAVAMLCHLRDASLRAASVNVVIGEKMRQRLLLRDISAAGIRVIANWADGDAIRPLPTGQSRLRGEFGLQQHFVVAYSGNLGRAHDVAAILEAATLLRHDPGTVFLMIGGGNGMSRLKQQSAGRGLGNFRFLPYQPQAALGDSLAAADVHLASLLPAMEGLILPSKCYGVFAAARPLVFIGDPQGEVATLIGSSACGHAVACGDGESLAQRLRELKADPGLCAQMGENAHKLYLARYSPDRSATAWVDALQLALQL